MVLGTGISVGFFDHGIAAKMGGYFKVPVSLPALTYLIPEG
jgi:hypothetical protein